MERFGWEAVVAGMYGIFLHLAFDAGNILVIFSIGDVNG